MGTIMFCSGGCRSGKSAFALEWAERRAESRAARKVFVATLEARDAEMRERVLRHQRERGADWDVLEVPVNRALELPALLERAAASEGVSGGVSGGKAGEFSGGRAGGVLVLDCLSAWVGACQELLAERSAEEAEGEIKAAFAASLGVLRRSFAASALVSCEVGLGLVPADASSRRFRDLLGLVNQAAAAEADAAWLLVSGLPLKLKG